MNLKKSRLVPSKKFQWLGTDQVTALALISLLVEKRKEVWRVLLEFIKTSLVSRSHMERILWKLHFVSIADLINNALSKSIYKNWIVPNPLSLQHSDSGFV